MNTMARWWTPITSARPNGHDSRFHVEEITPDRKEVFASVLLRATEAREQMTPTIISHAVGTSKWRFYVAVDGDEPVACAALFVDGNGAWLGLAATLPSHRRQGAQSLLIRRRMSDAASLGCEWATTESAPDASDDPGMAYGNMMRAGFTALYRRTNYLFTTPLRAVEQ